MEEVKLTVKVLSLILIIIMDGYRTIIHVPNNRVESGVASFGDEVPVD